MDSLYLVKVEPGANNNKYYRMLQLNDSSFEVQYGRIGVDGFQKAQYSMSKWNSKKNEKLKKGYIDQTRLVAEVVIKHKNNQYIEIENQIVRDIVEKLQSMARQAIRENYTISSNNVSQQMIDEAQVLLNDLIVQDSIEEFNHVLVTLFKTIPRKMKRVSDYLANSKDDFGKILETEQDLLDVMKGQVIQNIVCDQEVEEEVAKPTQNILDVMGIEFEEIDDNDRQIILRNLGSISSRFNRAWKVKNIKTQSNYDKFIAENQIKNEKLLFHGSRNENWWSIINTGLVLRPNAVITGKMFGLGIYYSPHAQKSLGYTSISGSYWVKGNSSCAYMSLYQVAYGTPYNVYDFNSKYYDLNYEKLQQFQKGANCLHAHADKGMLRNDEIIVFKENQCTIKYLIELK